MTSPRVIMLLFPFKNGKRDNNREMEVRQKWGIKKTKLVDGSNS